MDVSASISIIREAARERRFLSYGELARQHGLEWSAKVRTEVFRHLDEVNMHARDLGWPLLSVLVTNSDNVATGHMNPKTLEGFVRKATEVHGMAVGDAEAFVADQQHAVFEWANATAPD